MTTTTIDFFGGPGNPAAAHYLIIPHTMRALYADCIEIASETSLPTTIQRPIQVYTNMHTNPEKIPDSFCDMATHF